MTFSSRNPFPRLFGALISGLILICCLAATPAIAGPLESKAAYEKYMGAARKLYGEKRYEEAIVEFEKAFSAHPDPKIHFNLAQSHRLLGQDKQALEHYRKFLEAIPGIGEFSEEKKQAMTAEVQKRIRALEESITPPKDPTPEPAIDPGATPAPEPSPPSTAAGPSGLTTRWWFWTGVGVTAAFTLGTVWAGAKALGSNDDWEQGGQPADRDRALKYQDMTDTFLAGAVITAAAVGVVSWMYHKKHGAQVHTKASPVSLVPGCAAHGCVLTLSWQF